MKYHYLNTLLWLRSSYAHFMVQLFTLLAATTFTCFNNIFSFRVTIVLCVSYLVKTGLKDRRGKGF